MTDTLRNMPRNIRNTDAFGWQWLTMADPTADTAAAMLVAVRSAQLSKQPLAVGLADALDKLVERLPEDHETGRLLSCDCVEAIIDHLRNNHA